MTGVLEASDEDVLADLLDERDLFLIDAGPAKKKEERGRLFESIKARDLLAFTSDMATMLSVGISLTQSMRDLADGAEKVKMKLLIQDLLASVEAGSSLSASFARHPKVFDDVYVSIVQAGEDSGNLDRVLSDLEKFLEWKGDLRRDIVQALIYPVMVMTAVFGLVLLLATVVFPQFANVLRQARGPMPIPTQILFGLSELLVGYWWVLLLSIIVFGISFLFWVRTEKGRLRFDGLLLRLPIFGVLVRDIRDIRTFAFLPFLPDPVQCRRRRFANAADPPGRRRQQGAGYRDSRCAERNPGGRIDRQLPGRDREVPADDRSSIPRRRNERAVV